MELDEERKDRSGVLTPEETVTIRLFPNPVDQILGIEWKGFDSNEPISVSILDLYGTIVLTRDVDTDEKSLNVSSLSKGYYILQARQQDILKIERLIKK